MSLEVALALFEYVVLLLAISLHDAAQSWVAARFGDPTAKMLGRQSMNPVKHFDLFGTLIFPIFYMVQSSLIFGWGKPVPVTERNFRRAKDEMLVYLSGPVAHLLGAGVCLAVLVLLKHRFRARRRRCRSRWRWRSGCRGCRRWICRRSFRRCCFCTTGSW